MREIQKPLEISASRHAYSVHFSETPFERLSIVEGGSRHVIVDRTVRKLYQKELACLENFASVLEVEASEEAKSLHHFPAYVAQLMEAGFKKDHTLVAIGGGIVQDITAFIATTLMRGVRWEFYPTTLLAQADSCIGSKSSINVDNLKNILGSFYPPTRVDQCSRVLGSLDERDVRSGIGEILKAFIIDGPSSFDRLANDYEHLQSNEYLLTDYIHMSLRIKKRFIERDEFDQGVRNVFNYGHSFGHAIEVATKYAVPHGLAVSIGMDLANFVAHKVERLAFSRFEFMHNILEKNYAGMSDIEMPLSRMISAMGNDKKNTGSELTLILLNSAGNPEKVSLKNDEIFYLMCKEFFETYGPLHVVF